MIKVSPYIGFVRSIKCDNITGLWTELYVVFPALFLMHVYIYILWNCIHYKFYEIQVSMQYEIIESLF